MRQIFRAWVAGVTLDEVKKLIRRAMKFHLEGIRQHGDPIPAPSHNRIHHGLILVC
jgi:predicted RNase H-like HicB family nuclease